MKLVLFLHASSLSWKIRRANGSSEIFFSYLCLPATLLACLSLKIASHHHSSSSFGFNVFLHFVFPSGFWISVDDNPVVSRVRFLRFVKLEKLLYSSPLCWAVIRLSIFFRKFAIICLRFLEIGDVLHILRGVWRNGTQIFRF